MEIEFKVRNSVSIVITFQMRKQTVGVCSLQVCQHQNKIGKIPVLFMQLPRLRVPRTEGCRSWALDPVLQGDSHS